jgi:hypothetical protein
MTNIIDLKKELHNNWVILKDEAKTVDARTISAKRLVELYKEIEKIPDSGVTIIDLVNTTWASFLGEQTKKSKYPTELPKGWEAEEKRYLEVVALAHKIVSDREPNLEEGNKNLFGQIVNATVSNLIALRN